MQRSKGLGVKEIISLCVLNKTDENKLCRTIPTASKDSVYLLDLSTINIKDITCDDSGIYDEHSSPSSVVKVDIDENEIVDFSILSRKKVKDDEDYLKESNVFVVKRLYSEQKKEYGKASRIISRVYSQGKPAKYAVVQYLGERICHLKPHKNAKSKDVYLRTKPSVLSKEKALLSEVAPKQVINIIESDDSQSNISASDAPRNRQQIYNQKKKCATKFKARNTGKVVTPDFGKLVASMDNSGFLKDVDFSYRQKFGRIHPNTFAATDNSMLWLKSFCCTNSNIKSQLGIDMTYKVGPFYTTCFSFPHPMFVHKHDRQKHPTIFAGMMTSTGRQVEDYMYLANQLRSRGVTNLIYGTDGEYALEQGMEAVFPIEGITPEKRSIKLRCFNHLSGNLEVELKKFDVNRKDIITEILGKEYGNLRTPGLVDCPVASFEQQYKTLSSHWPPEFVKYLESTELKVRSVKETLKKCMNVDVRKAAGLGNPPNKYDNQRAEAMNSVLKETISQIVDQSAVHEHVNKKLMEPQEKELIKAIYCHGEYRLADRYRNLEIDPLQWKTMTDEQKTRHINKVLHCKIVFTEEAPVITKKLSIQPQDCKLDSFIDIPLALITELWDGAEILMSCGHITTLANGNHCIAIGNDFYLVTENKEFKFQCKCEKFDKLQLCSHVMVIADQRGVLLDILNKFKYDPSHAIYRHKPISAGEKGVKKPRKGIQNVRKQPLDVQVNIPTHTGDDINLRNQRPFQYCEVWHNDEPFIVNYIKDLKHPKDSILQCTSCRNVISKKNAMIPFDIVISHKERYKYPLRQSDGSVIWKTSEKRMVNKYYCVKRSCLLERHPYFWTGLLGTDQVELKEEHLGLLRRELDFEV